MENLPHGERDLLSKDGVTGFSTFVLVDSLTRQAAQDTAGGELILDRYLPSMLACARQEREKFG